MLEHSGPKTLLKDLAIESSKTLSPGVFGIKHQLFSIYRVHHFTRGVHKHGSREQGYNNILDGVNHVWSNSDRLTRSRARERHIREHHYTATHPRLSSHKRANSVRHIHNSEHHINGSLGDGTQRGVARVHSRPLPELRSRRDLYAGGAGNRNGILLRKHSFQFLHKYSTTNLLFMFRQFEKCRGFVKYVDLGNLIVQLRD